MTSVLISDAMRATTLIPFSLWTPHGNEASMLAKAKLPYLHTWLTKAKRVEVQLDKVHEPLLATLSPPHERGWAQMMGWPTIDGCLPWAERVATTRGLISHGVSPQTGWAFITLCNWQVRNGQVTLGDPADLQLDESMDAQLFQAMQSFFAEDGIVLYPYKVGQWLAQSSLFVDLPTASLDRVIGRNVNSWLVGSEVADEVLSPAAKLLRRLQNEMQMLLYTHPINTGRNLAINSFWIHGTGRLPAIQPLGVEPRMVNSLCQSALRQDFMGWLQAWQHMDVQVIAPMLAHLAAGESQRLVLCGENELHVYDSVKPSFWQRARTYFVPTSLDTVLAVRPLKD